MALNHDEELGKRDDDFRPRRHQRSPSSSVTSTFPFKWRRRRVLVVIGVLFLIYVIHLYVPGGLGTGYQTDTFKPKPARTFAGHDAILAKEPRGAPPRDWDAEGEDQTAKHYYNGPTKFYKLGGTLQRASRTMGISPQNRNVLFVAASLKSVANLIPMACEMAKEDKNNAHFAVFGRSPLSIEVIQELNGIDETCGIHWHDARGDYAEYSSDARVESAVRGAMKHIQEYLHPQVMIMDDSRLEEAFFTTAMQKKAKDMEKALIEVPRGRYEDFLWMTKLGAGSLAHWFSPTLDIVIQAPRGSSGRLIRLLQSLYNADYRGLKAPRLNIELPPDIEPGLQNYLNGFSWPPNKVASQPNLLTIHHRIPSQRMSSEQASLRFVESFYPTQHNDHHVLLLSPQAAVSPLYYQYLYYAILNHRYSTYGASDAENLLGVSLDVPVTTLNGTEPFKGPKVSDMSYSKVDDNQEIKKEDDSPFLYQAPTAKATLIFGDKWAAFHDFLTNRLQASHLGHAKKGPKLVSETEPAWLEYLLELMSARNWLVLHPATPLVTIHNELAQIPEEYTRPAVADKEPSKPTPEHPEEEAFILSADVPVIAEHREAELEQSPTPLHKLLPFGGEIQNIAQLPHLGFDGQVTTVSALTDLQDDYVKFFRKAIGGCTGEAVSRPRKIDPVRTNDLFCLPGELPRYADEMAPELDFDEAEEIALAIAEGSKAHADAEDVPEPMQEGIGASTKATKPGMVKLVIPEKARPEDDAK
ncbi:hypothetical protein Slin15195_G101880 [Septoria linicola]|uniref:Glycosyltransferase 2 n=1 Tax=Septoria linicola TaxID=215465 RepID=A0A9Q9AWS5_9PEZI|nr:hypothetical protein Slin14017_G064880 [Septoria linicola]USW56869.1 hypothetical protein Slin15195_G101880 [Septoria linicola]